MPIRLDLHSFSPIEKVLDLQNQETYQADIGKIATA